MKKRLMLGLLTGGLLVAMLPGVAAAGGNETNQGDSSLVLVADNTDVDCGGDAVASTKVQGGLGRVIEIWSDAPIDKVTIKSGEGAYVLDTWFSGDGLHAWIELSKDVSNYVVWTCPPSEEEETS